jgi:hypothetical protein
MASGSITHNNYHYTQPFVADSSNQRIRMICAKTSRSDRALIEGFQERLPAWLVAIRSDCTSGRCLPSCTSTGRCQISRQPCPSLAAHTMHVERMRMHLFAYGYREIAPSTTRHKRSRETDVSRGWEHDSRGVAVLFLISEFIVSFRHLTLSWFEILDRIRDGHSPYVVPIKIVVRYF